MNEKLKLVVDSIEGFKQEIISEADLKQIIINWLADDKNIIPNLFLILEAERKENKELLLDSNLEVSRSIVALETFVTDKKKDTEFQQFTIDKIKEHYLKWAHKIKCCFKIEGLP